MRVWREWVEEHWAGVELVVFIASALTISIIVAIAFNVIATRFDGLHRDTANAAPSVSNLQSKGSASPES